MHDLSHLPPTEVPLALRELHGDVAVGETVGLAFARTATVADGRGWSEDLLRAVLEGAGFDVRSLTPQVRPASERFHVVARRERTIADTVGADMRMLLVGLNPSLVAADAGVGFHRRGNRAWPALLRAGLATVDRDPVDLLLRHRIGMTDLVKRASPRAAELTAEEYAHGVDRLDRICAWLRPGLVCVMGVTGWRHAVDRDARTGPQERRLGGCRVRVVPNPSGANAHVTLDDMAAQLRAAFDDAGDDGVPRDCGRDAP